MADPISYETVTETWQRMADTPIDQAQRLVDQMEQEQPLALVYLLALDDYPFAQNEREIIFYIGAVIWQIMKQSQKPLQPVQEETLVRTEETNYKFLELLSEDTEADFMSATRNLIDNYAEPEVLRYLVEALMEDLDDDLIDFVEYKEGEFEVEEFAEDMLPDTNGFEETEEIQADVEIEDEDDWDDDDEGYDLEDLNIRDEYRGLAFVILKTVLDAFIESRDNRP